MLDYPVHIRMCLPLHSLSLRQTYLYACNRISHTCRDHDARQTRNFVVAAFHFNRLLETLSTPRSQLYTGHVRQQHNINDCILDPSRHEAQMGGRMGRRASLGQPHVLAFYHLDHHLRHTAPASLHIELEADMAVDALHRCFFRIRVAVPPAAALSRHTLVPGIRQRTSETCGSV
jgi:hypothetical protein